MLLRSRVFTVHSTISSLILSTLLSLSRLSFFLFYLSISLTFLPPYLSLSLSLPQALYMFLALAIVCDDYFVMSLEKICEVGELSSQ